MALSWGPLVGIAQLAIGRREGILRFRSTPGAFLTSLAPWILFPLAAAALGKVNEPLLFVAAVLVGQLTPPVLTHALAVRWGRGEAWLRYATAYNWCQWAVSIVFLGLLLLMAVATGSQEPAMQQVGLLMLVVVGFYGWISWVVARSGLGIGPGRAALLVVVVNVATFMLLLIPQWIGAVVAGVPPS